MTSDRPPTGEIAKALAAFQDEMPVVPKNKKATVPTKAGGSYSYTYADLADVTSVAMPLMSKHGLSFSSCPRRTDHGYELVGLLLHTSGETLNGSLPIHGNQAQEIGSSLTYLRRYLLGCMTGLVTDDDDDGTAAQPARRTEPKITQKTRGQMFALFAQKGVSEEQQLPGINHYTSGSYTSRGDITEADAKKVVARLQSLPDVPPPKAETADPSDPDDPWTKEEGE